MLSCLTYRYIVDGENICGREELYAFFRSRDNTKIRNENTVMQMVEDVGMIKEDVRIYHTLLLWWWERERREGKKRRGKGGE